MATYKLLQDRRRIKKDGTYPIVIRVYIGDTYSTIKTGLSVPPKFWDDKRLKIKSSYPNSDQLNNLLTAKKIEAESIVLSGNVKVPQKGLKQPQNGCILSELWTQHLQELKEEGRVGNSEFYRHSLNAISRVYSLDIHSSDLDTSVIQKIEHLLRKNGCKPNTIGAYFRAFKAVLNKGVQASVIAPENYPFRGYKIPSQVTRDRIITREEIRLIEEVELPVGSKMDFYRKIGLLIFYFRGMNFIDLVSLKPSDVKGDHVFYRRSKTHKLYTVNIVPKARIILDEFQKMDTPIAVLQYPPQGKSYSNKKQMRKTCNKYLKRIGKQLGIAEPLTTYVFRYSWANCAKQLGYSNEMIAEGLGHSFGNPVTNIYLSKYSQKELDKMNVEVCTY